MFSRRGFSLIEILIVVAIISIIATIAIPILLSARKNAMDEKARQSIRNVISAEQAYYARFGTYAPVNILAASDPPFLDQRFSSGIGVIGNSMLVNVLVAAGGQEFTATVSNPGGNFNFQGDETGLVVALP